jgi:glycerate-2-kinase
MIKNRTELLGHGKCVKARKLLLGALETSLLAADPTKLVKKHVKFTRNILQIADRFYSLDDFDHAYVIGAGKASGYMAEALNEVLNDKINDGLVIIPDYFKTELKTGNIELWYGTHPIPSSRNVKGTRKMLDIVKDATTRDLIICLISGGGSALMALPYEDITITQKRKVSEELLRAGATIEEINAVRKHISSIKGGRLAEMLSRSTIISLIISDVIGDKLDAIASGPTAPDPSTFTDAMLVLKKYGLWKGLDNDVRKIIMRGVDGKIPETPKPNNKVFKRVRNFIIGNNRLACIAAYDHLKSKGVRPVLLTTFMRGEAREVGTIVSSIVRQISRGGVLAKPASIILGGETTVTVTGNGVGGRNQELVLSAAGGIDNVGNTAIAAIGTDGIDGNSDAAGAIADSTTIKRAQKMKMIPAEFLARNNSNTFFRKLDDLILTGPTGTNVNDIVIIICL